METQPTPRAALRRGSPRTKLLLALLLLALAVSLFSILLLAAIILGPYEGRIYPNIYVMGIPLGGLTPEEGAARLAASGGGEGTLTLTDGERQWAIPWSELGVQLDVDGTVRAAYAVGRNDQGLDTLWRLWTDRYDISPVYRVDPSLARPALEQLAQEVYVPPTDATFRVEGGELIPLPGQPGWALDVESSLAQLITVVAALGPDVSLRPVFVPVPPDIPDAGPAVSQAEEILGRPIHISAYDPLAAESFSWTVDRESMVTWLRPVESSDGMLAVEVEREAVQATISGLAAEMGEGRGFRPGEAADQVVALLMDGGGEVSLYVTHPARTYVVQAGDTLGRIAVQVGMPPGLIAEANPGVDLDHLYIGQGLTIPSQDILTPYLPVPGKRIVISLSEQRMRVYEGGALLYEWPVSTGIPSSPTYPGVYQILSKEENAYASQWDLWMPHFLAIYRAGGEVYNGIHALPILSNGQRLWEGLLGTPASYGCIILGIEQAAVLYDWAEIGVIVIIE